MSKNENVTLFGSKSGTRTYAINAALSSRKAKSVREIAEETGTSAVYNHIRTLMHKGIVVMDGKKYKLKPKSNPVAAHAAKPSSKYASKEEAAAAKNARRREARAAKKAANAVVSENVAETVVS